MDARDPISVPYGDSGVAGTALPHGGDSETATDPTPVAIEPPRRLETLSPSRAGDFKTCPQLFKFRAVDKLPEPTTVHQARGTTAHLALQRLIDRPRTERTPE